MKTQAARAEYACCCTSSSMHTCLEGESIMPGESTIINWSELSPERNFILKCDMKPAQ